MLIQGTEENLRNNYMIQEIKEKHTEQNNVFLNYRRIGENILGKDNKSSIKNYRTIKINI